MQACRRKFALAVDAQARVIRACDAQIATRPDMADRTSYVIGRDSRIAFAHRDGNPDIHVAQTLKAVTQLAAAARR